MRGHAILTAAAERADPERAVAMLAEAAAACFYAGNPADMLSVAQRASDGLPGGASLRTRFLAAIAIGMARVAGGDAAAGAEAIRKAIALAESSAELQADLRLLPWLAVAPLFLRDVDAGRELLDRALETARTRAAVGALPFVLNLIALDHATTDRWAVAEAAVEQFERQQRLLSGLRMTDADVSPGPELVDACVRLGHSEEAQQLAAEFIAAAHAKRQPRSLARALRAQGLVASADRFAAYSP